MKTWFQASILLIGLGLFLLINNVIKPELSELKTTAQANAKSLETIEKAFAVNSFQAEPLKVTCYYYKPLPTPTGGTVSTQGTTSWFPISQSGYATWETDLAIGKYGGSCELTFRQPVKLLLKTKNNFIVDGKKFSWEGSDLIVVTGTYFRFDDNDQREDLPFLLAYTVTKP